MKHGLRATGRTFRMLLRVALDMSERANREETHYIFVQVANRSMVEWIKTLFSGMLQMIGEYQESKDTYKLKGVTVLFVPRYAMTGKMRGIRPEQLSIYRDHYQGDERSGYTY